MEGLRQQSKSSAQDERGYGSVNPPRTTYAPALVSDPRSQQPSGSQSGARLHAPTGSVTRGNPATSLAAGASQSTAALGRLDPHGSGDLRSDQGDREEPSYTFDIAIEIALGLEPGGQAGMKGALEILRQDVNALDRETRELHGRVVRRVSASALKELRRGLDALSHEMHGRMPSYEPQGYSYHSAYLFPFVTVIPFV
ncbi:hypothetical protein PHPALM_30512 [Phytophthora palmivora]|uniref:Uncharacterized protein n=1 Tax=Phytophthora palmivora TaxID=4796 RepID=A0A2P4X4Z0_9STRA|nr:hypothetical protein PHPALM_30512 [Phytophthora palmivora]